ncbi:tetratricopeptide repeat protein [Ktedonobacter racemifer]|uniref:Transcriptional regulator, XRE family n=1 Tax=Ktedonobacter racemifer DSM 44963 TaxID=485913 RepID=D6TLW5_KTERA|nr:tetratricopeptide repeat protein [Ktedonobacter racemifer]EFH86765.1 transcriptional regulator, XRE family [Ktedonobacter racemifer DSM 44963]
MDHIPSTEPQPRLKLTEARIARSLSQQDVAEQIGTTHVNVSRWERGITRPNPYFRRKLCQLFGLTTQELDLVPSASSEPPAATTSNIDEVESPAEESPTPAATIVDPAVPLLPAIRLVGRDEELADIKRRLFTGGNVALTALNGLPGVGKTTLSIALAHDRDVRAHFRDGILWAGLGPKPNILGLLSRWGTLLGISATEMASLSDVHAWARAIHNAIGTRYMLLVIDDAWSTEEALAFKVGGSNCAHLLTTRYPEIASFIALDGAKKIQALNDEESMTLLRLLAPGVVDREVQKAQDLVHAVGGLPLALTLMGNYLRKQTYSGQTRRITAALERLSNAEERLQIQEPHGPVEAHPSLTTDIQLSLHSVISVTDQQLSPATRSAFYALSVFPARPNTFSEEAALAVATCEVDILDTLIDIGILESSGASRYTLHQTIRDYTYLQLQRSPEHDAAQRRLVAYTCAFLAEHSSDYEQLELESPTILTALEQAHRLAMLPELIQGTIAFTPYLQLRGLYAQAEQHLQRAQEAALTLNDQRTLSTLLLYTGQVLQQQGKLPQAADVFQQGLTLAREHNNPEQISAFLNDLGWVTWKLGNYTEAEKYLQEGLVIARKIDNKKRISSILRVLGSVYDLRGESAKSKECLQEGLTIAQQMQDHELAIAILTNLGVNAGQQGNYLQAKKYFQEGLETARHIGHRQRTSALLANLGAAEMDMKNYVQAEAYLKEGLEVARQIEHREWTSILLINLGLVTRRKGSYKQAESYLQESLTLSRQVGIPQMTAGALYELGNVLLIQNRLQEADGAFSEMLDILPEGAIDQKAQAQYGLARIAAIQENTQKAQQLGEQSLKVLEQIGHGNAEEVREWLSSIK